MEAGASRSDNMKPSAVSGLPPAAVALTGLAGLAISMGVARFAFTPILPMMQQDTGLSVADGGWLATANYLGFLIGALLAVFVRIPPSMGMRWGLVAIGVLTLAMAFEHRFAGWVALRAAAGFAGAWAQVLTFAWTLERLSAVQHPLWTGVFFGGVGVGIAVAGFYCLLLMRLGGSFDAAWIGFGAMSIVATSLVWTLLCSTDDGAPAVSPPMPLNVEKLRNADAWLVILCFGASGFGYIIPATFLPVMAREFVRDPAVFGWAWPVFGVATALGPLVASRWMPVFGSRRVWAGSHLLMAFGVALPVWWPTLGGIMVAALFVGITFMTNATASMQEARNIGGSNAAAMIAATIAAFATGQIAGPIGVSYLVARDGNFSEALITAAFLLVASAAALALRAR